MPPMVANLETFLLPITLHRSDFETQRFGQRACWEVCFAILQQLFARFQLLPTLSDSVVQGDRPPFGLPTVLRFARFRVIYISLALISLQVRRETAQTAKGWPFLLLPSFADALLRLPAAIDHTHMFPRPLAATNNAETRDLGLITRGMCGRCGTSWWVSLWYNDEHEKLQRRERRHHQGDHRLRH